MILDSQKNPTKQESRQSKFCYDFYKLMDKLGKSKMRYMDKEFLLDN